MFQLDINKTYSENQIKKVFKQLALKYHPDKTKTKNPEKYVQLQKAFLIIMTQKK